jgi:hypothetical protein
MGKIKLFIKSERGKDIFVILIVVLASLGSFELGRLSMSSRSEGLKIEYTDPEGVSGQNQAANALYADESADTATPTSNKVKGEYFASSRGTKYYPVGCSAGQTIKESNRVWFETREEAEHAGYELSSSCR